MCTAWDRIISTGHGEHEEASSLEAVHVAWAAMWDEDGSSTVTVYQKKLNFFVIYHHSVKVLLIVCKYSSGSFRCTVLFNFPEVFRLFFDEVFLSFSFSEVIFLQKICTLKFTIVICLDARTCTCYLPPVKFYANIITLFVVTGKCRLTKQLCISRTDARKPKIFSGKIQGA